MRATPPSSWSRPSSPRRACGPFWIARGISSRRRTQSVDARPTRRTRAPRSESRRSSGRKYVGTATPTLSAVVKTSRITCGFAHCSTERTLITKLGKTLRRVRAAFSELELRWYVFGARAAIAYGVVRATDDIDVTVDPAEHSAAAIARALASQGFVLEFADPAFVAQTRVLPVRDATGVAATRTERTCATCSTPTAAFGSKRSAGPSQSSKRRSTRAISCRRSKGSWRSPVLVAERARSASREIAEPGCAIAPSRVDSGVRFARRASLRRRAWLIRRKKAGGGLPRSPWVGTRSTSAACLPLFSTSPSLARRLLQVGDTRHASVR